MSITAYYHGEQETLHPQLSLLVPGKNEFPDEQADIVEQCVSEGLLTYEPAAESESPPHVVAEEAEAEAGGQEPEA
jgi:hypothetical protein